MGCGAPLEGTLLRGPRRAWITVGGSERRALQIHHVGSAAGDDPIGPFDHLVECRPGACPHPQLRGHPRLGRYVQGAGEQIRFLRRGGQPERAPHPGGGIDAATATRELLPKIPAPHRGAVRRSRHDDASPDVEEPRVGAVCVVFECDLGQPELVAAAASFGIRRGDPDPRRRAQRQRHGLRGAGLLDADSGAAPVGGHLEPLHRRTQCARTCGQVQDARVDGGVEVELQPLPDRGFEAVAVPAGGRVTVDRSGRAAADRCPAELRGVRRSARHTDPCAFPFGLHEVGVGHGIVGHQIVRAPLVALGADRRRMMIDLPVVGFSIGGGVGHGQCVRFPSPACTVGREHTRTHMPGIGGVQAQQRLGSALHDGDRRGVHRVRPDGRVRRFVDPVDLDRPIHRAQVASATTPTGWTRSISEPNSATRSMPGDPSTAR